MIVSTGRDLSAQVKPPRTVFVNFPMGNTFGKAFDASQQRAILRDVLAALESITAAGEIIDLAYKWHEEFGMNLGAGYQAKSD
ncbi:MAG: hypothetical protein Q7S58_16980 [Candidatus Binatus sp.]|uniref:hypothetical protein n=1 Tax=Candidatus Binatus sp. TaxID=2811406 RepID=UPI002717034F|nr:hypothetical protein [Candidatus Binatus sp.]MDO8434094.1 hypothetical protein [Candidatus Binatus sp.]